MADKETITIRITSDPDAPVDPNLPTVAFPLSSPDWSSFEIDGFFIYDGSKEIGIEIGEEEITLTLDGDE